MGVIVVTGAFVQCPFGTVPATLKVTSQNTVLIDGKPAATIQDTAAIANISSCGMCLSMANPQVAAATAAALGVLTPQPCVPAVAGGWIPTQMKCLAQGIPCLTQDATAMCSYGGSITIKHPGQTKVTIG